MLIDVHAHFWTDEYLDKIAALGKTDTATQRGMGAGDGAEMDGRLALMDHTGVQMQVLSASPQLPHSPDRAAAVDAARYVNDQYADLTARHPGRFRAFASLPLPHLDASLAELGRALDDLGMVGVAMTTTILDRPLVDSPAAQLFAELDRRGTVLYLHPAGNAACTPLIGDHHGTWSIGAPVEDTISALHLITHGIPSRYPRMKILNSHLGGALPMLLQRMDNQLPWEAPETPEPPWNGSSQRELTTNPLSGKFGADQSWQAATRPDLRIMLRLALGRLQQPDKPKSDTQDEVRPTGRWEPMCADTEPRRPT